MPNITTRTIKSLVPKSTSYFIRDSKVKGVAVKVNPSGTIKLIAEVRYQGKTHRKDIGQYPYISLDTARQETVSFIQRVKTGRPDKILQSYTLETLYLQFIKTRSLKVSTLKSYNETVNFYLDDWFHKPVNSISKQMVEQRFFQIRDKGINGGIPSIAQASKAMRILSVMMNYALANEVIEFNPVSVLKLKRITRTVEKRENYLPALKVRELLDKTSSETHPVTLAIHLMLYTGLRKNEALRLKWANIKEVEGLTNITLISSIVGHYYANIQTKRILTV